MSDFKKKALEFQKELSAADIKDFGAILVFCDSEDESIAVAMNAELRMNKDANNVFSSISSMLNKIFQFQDDNGSNAGKTLAMLVNKQTGMVIRKLDLAAEALKGKEPMKDKREALDEILSDLL